MQRWPRCATTGRVVASILDELRPMVRPGVNLLAIEKPLPRAASPTQVRSPATGTTRRPSATGPFRNTICLSLNDAVLHGLPYYAVLRDGDLLSLDLAVSLDGVGGGQRDQRDRGDAARRGRPADPRHRGGPRGRHRRRAVPATRSATSRTRSPRSRVATATSRTTSTAATASDARCTRARRSRTRAGRAAATRCGTA